MLRSGPARRAAGRGATALDGPRGVRPEELPALLRLIDAVFRAEAPGMQAEFPTLFHPRNGPWLRSFWDGGEAVAHAGLWLGRIRSRGRVLNVAHLGAVCTAPQARGRGLATALLDDTLPRLRSAGVGLLLISGDRPLYRRVGARPVPGLRRRTLDAAAAAALGPEASVLEMPAPEAVAALRALHAAEPVRYERTAEEWEALLPAKGYLPGREGRCAALVGPAGGPPVAYLLCGRPRRDGRDPGVLPVDEFGGDRRAVLAALPTLLRRAGCGRAALLSHPGDAALEAALEGIRAEEARHQGTAVVIDPVRCGLPAGDPDPGPDAAARQTEALCVAWELPRNDGLQYI